MRNLKSMVKEFKKILVSTFDEHCDSRLFTPRYRLLDHMVKGIRTFRMVSAFDSSTYEH